MSEETCKHERKSIGLTTKIIAVMTIVLIAVVTVNYLIFMSTYRRDVITAMMDKAAVFTAAADEAVEHATTVFQSDALDFEKLSKDMTEDFERSGTFESSIYYALVPVVNGWTVARDAAEREGIEFRTPSFDARNPKNTPVKGSFSEQLLRELEDGFSIAEIDSIGRVDPDTNTLHYMRAVILDASCMLCHGDPRTDDPDGDGIDPFGMRMENWSVGDMHGAYEVVMPLGPVDAQVAGFFKQGLMVTVPIAIVGIGGILLLIRLVLTNPMNNLIQMMKDVATGNGDLTKRMNLNRSDEIGRLGGWFDTFLERMHEIMCEIASVTHQVAAASNEIAASSEEMAAGLGEQQNQTQQASTAVQELTQSVGEVARQSTVASTAAEKSRVQATQGGMVVQETVQEIMAIAVQVEESAHAVAELGKRSEEIGGIIAVINDIADQTNLLALNAAIEAARAGEHGRGFAVVADEVRKLAERTTQATKEVSRSISKIQNETGVAVDRIESGSNRMTDGVTLARNAGNALEQIVTSSSQLFDQVQSIAAASEQQAIVAEEIARSIDQVNAVALESSLGANQAADAASDLNRSSESMQRLVDHFKL